VDDKPRIGDWEIDTVIGKGHSGTQVTVVERQSNFTVSKEVSSKCAKDVTGAIIEFLKPYKVTVHTIMADNGKEFGYHEKFSQSLAACVYFVHPYSSWERGLSENTNGLLSQYYSKKTDFKKITSNLILGI